MKSEFLKYLRNYKLVLGNGADLYCKFMTSYSDYFNSKEDLNSLLYQVYNQDNLDLNVIERNIENKKDFNPFNSVKPKINVWYFYFYLKSRAYLKQPKIDSIKWCDIEDMMKKSFDNEKNITTTGYYPYNFWDRVYNLIFNYISYDGYSYSFDEKWLAWLILNNMNFNNHIHNSKDFYEYLLIELNIFEKDFVSYLFNFGCKDPVGLCESKREELYEQLITDDINSIDTFNYTSCNKALLSENKNNISVFHINGSFKPNGVTDAIFGVYSKDYKPNEERYIFTKTSRRMNRNIISNEIHNFDFKDAVIFGHSLNEQDYSYFFSLFDTMELSNFHNDSKLIFAYNIYDGEKQSSIINDLRVRVIKLLTEYSKYLNKSDLTLIDTLSFQGRLLFYKID